MKHPYSPNIEPRQLHFVCGLNPDKYWHSGSDIKTYHFNALAIFLPQLEKMLVLSLKKALHEVSNDQLKSEVASLVAQEAIHGRAFARYCEQLVFQHYACSKQYSLWFFRGLAGLINHFSRTFHYALSAAGEHFTAIAADLFLREPKWFTGVPTEHSAIWRWHCIEEIEHQEVAFDVYQATNGKYLTRILAMVLMSIFFIVLYIKPIWFMMKQDGNHKNRAFYQRAWQYYFGKGGLVRALWQPYTAYFKRSFHPRQQQNLHLINHWKRYFQTRTKQQIVTDLQYPTPPHSY